MKNTGKLLAVILVLIPQILFSIDFVKIEKHVDETPSASTKTTTKLSKYLTGVFEDDDEKFAAIYFWVSKNIRYDVRQRNKARMYFSANELVNEVLRSKKGVCQHYAELFNELSLKAGLKSFVIIGYGKESGKVMKLSHAWNAIKIDNNWYFIDATWGSGHILDGKYKKSFKLKYFMVEPKEFILDHIPFDPMWQLLKQPIKFDEFDLGKIGEKSTKDFMYNDSIVKYSKLSEIERKTNKIRRIDSNGRKNKLVIAELKQERNYIKISQKNEQIKNLNSGNFHYNAAVKQLNEYYKLKQKKGKSISKFKLLMELDSIEKKLTLARKLYAKINTTDREILNKLRQATGLVKKFEKIMKEQRAMLR
ncbi:MAG: hypothetical protein B6I20_06575 [Bacteroidetes bacterium 4572_117]|nr:MAG: hypothetical protein B6I20_06575 [Bacteroidetes bacterium 4572_117]